jgi:hypothetical protein
MAVTAATSPSSFPQSSTTSRCSAPKTCAPDRVWHWFHNNPEIQQAMRLLFT